MVPLYLVSFLHNLYPNVSLKVHKLWMSLFFGLILTIKYIYTIILNDIEAYIHIYITPMNT